MTYFWPFPGVSLPGTPGTAVEQPGSPSPAAPAVTLEAVIAKYVVPPRHCVDCNVELDKKQLGLRCVACQADEDALLTLDAAYWDLFKLVRYGRLLNHCDEGQVYIRLIADTCRDALAYARARLDDVA